ncbi:bifunctional folylpolyglutamate synthase/dihydrofolate synthase [Parasporobacterium paucivorans]|uniref:tetrahydrofolate synthase n=1 Tax=Parasporobacterium paucivorans DSM 15970 TaxID=1122934 RepID=A0A1M6G9T4_9FIRM|nr:folylpolyglutamate synthase/dihydrofolate synthase family protein [Parasporobacterium paucivorans]SHJ06730.1 dihydrofolate synthase / folylpolyglutamate synthase [Parasporobacterium paucivorans DSM 15970]
MNYEETLEYINSINWMGSKLGLERIQGLLLNLGNPQKQLKFIHIGGTNGKGSTAAMLSSVLIEAGYRTGLFTSPYVNFFNERMQIDNVPISNDELALIATDVRPHADTMEDPPTEFELNTAIAMEYFKRNQCDIVVLEVGMGGELDSTNVIDFPELAVITAIGLDHVNELGGTLDAIARTKAGIIKNHTDVLVYQQDEKIESIIKEYCESKDAKYHSPDFSQVIPGIFDIDSQTFSYKGEKYTIPLIGSYQVYNAAMVLEAVSILRSKNWKISEEAVGKGLKKTRWPGRFEVLKRNPIVIVDGSHNPQGIKATAESIRKYFQGKRIIFLMGIMADKDVDAMLDEIVPLASEFFTVTPDNSRAMPAEKLASLLEKKGANATACISVAQGVDRAIEASGNDGVVCAIGSLYMVGDVRAYIIGRKGDIENGI